MIRKIIALSIVLAAVSAVFTGCDKKPVKENGVDAKETEDNAAGAAKDAVDEHAGHNHD